MKIKISIPEGYEDITIAEYQEMTKAITEEDNPYKVIAIACRVPLDIVMQLSLDYTEILLQELSWMFQEPKIDTKLKPRFFLNDIEYGIIPNLSKLTVGEFSDLEYLTQNDTYSNLHRIMAILYRPITSKSGDMYEVIPYKDYDIDLHDMSQMPISVAISALLFFYDIEKILYNAISPSLQENQEKVS